MHGNEFHESAGAALPTGVIVMWGGLIAAVPAGFALCDGQNGTPDLRDRFILGRADDLQAASGGATSHSHAGHAVTQPAPHTDVVDHVHVQNINSAATGALRGATPDTSTNTSVASGYSTANPTGGVASQPHSGVTVDAHSSESHQPPYYRLCFIQKLA